jgi:hypothetical protein
MPVATPRARRRAAAAVLLVCSVAASCSGDDGPDEPAARPTPRGEVSLELGAATLHGVGPATELDPATLDAVRDAVDRYVEVAMVRPILTGKRARNLDDLFAPTVSEHVGRDGDDRVALADEGLPRATADLESSATPITIDALTAPDDAPILVAARFRVEVSARTDDGSLTVARRAELTFEEAPDGSWLISAYRVTAKRETPGGGSTTTTAEGGA